VNLTVICRSLLVACELITHLCMYEITTIIMLKIGATVRSVVGR
jgi:hypothetical protein